MVSRHDDPPVPWLTRMLAILNGLMGTRHDLVLHSLTIKAARNDTPRRVQESLESCSLRSASRKVGLTGVICKTAVARYHTLPNVVALELLAWISSIEL